MQFDSSIREPHDDKFGRVELARTVAQVCLQSRPSAYEANDASQGFVVSIEGTWGSGKTSFMNLVKSQLNLLICT